MFSSERNHIKDFFSKKTFPRTLFFLLMFCVLFLFFISTSSLLFAALPLNPEVVSTIPASDATGVALDQVITVQFDRAMDASTINADSFLLTNTTGQAVTVSLEYNPANFTVTARPDVSLLPETQYTVTLTTGIRDTQGNPLVSSYSWMFSTGNYNNPHGNYSDNTNACKSCHEVHAAKSGSLLNQNIEIQVCYSCHDGSGSSHNIKVLMDQTGPTQSYHPIKATGNPAVGEILLCSDCHNAHGNKDATGQIYPNLLRASNGTTTAYEGSQFCLICHDGSSSSNLMDKTGYISSIHAQSGVECVDCHASHSSPYPNLKSDPEDTTMVDGECLRCHGGNPPAQFASAPDVRTNFAQPNRHPALDISGAHSDTEDYSLLSAGQRHAECVDCHDPHSVQKSVSSTTTSGAITIDIPNSPLNNTAGVDAAYDGTSWADWETTKSWNFILAITSEYQLCYKCHSSYSWGTSPPLASGEPQTDIPKEFNPNNPSYHAVVGTSKIQTYKDSTGVTKYYGVFVNGWTATSQMLCVSCHDSHGSSIPNMVNNDCLACHDSSFYASSSGENDPDVRSAFSNSNNNNIHRVHYNKVPDLTCYACHSGVPHGYFREGLLVLTSDSAPYNKGNLAKLDSILGSPGNWTKISCSTSCHSTQQTTVTTPSAISIGTGTTDSAIGVTPMSN